MFDGEGTESGKPIISHLLVLHCTAHDYIVVAVAPVFGNALQESVYTLREEVEPEVVPPLYHLPAFRPPQVSVLEQEIRGEAGEYNLSAFNLPGFVTLSLDGEIEVAGLSAFAAGNLAAVHLILPIDIAVLATGAYLGATVPRIPVGINFPILGHCLVRATQSSPFRHRPRNDI